MNYQQKVQNYNLTQKCITNTDETRKYQLAISDKYKQQPQINEHVVNI